MFEQPGADSEALERRRTRPGAIRNPLTGTDSLKSSRTGEVVAAVGVILSLLFVGFEIRQNTAVARGQARHALAELNQEWLMLMSQDSTAAAIWNKVYGGLPGEISEHEASRAEMMMTLHLRRLENVYFQYSEGLVDESALHSYGLQQPALFQRQSFQRYWVEKEWRSGFDPAFVEFFEDAMGLSSGREEHGP